MKGNQAIIQKIIQDAEQLASATIQEAQQHAQEKMDKLQEYQKRMGEKAEAQRKAAQQESIRRRKSVAQLDVRKFQLNAKKELIRQTFEAAQKSMYEDTDAYLAWTESMLEKYGQEGDTICICEADRQRITPEFVQKVAKKCGKNWTLSEENGDFQGGMILRSKGVDKNLTFQTLFRLLQEEIEPEVARVLFHSTEEKNAGKL